MQDSRKAINGLIIGLLWLTLGIFLCQSGYTYELSGRSWNKPYLVYFNPDECPEDLLDILKETIDSLSYFMDISYEGLTDGEDNRDNINTVFCSDNFSQKLIYLEPGIEYAEDYTALGRAHTWFITPNIIEVDIGINPDVGEELRLVLEHEFGHALGLSHVINPLALMNFILINKELSWYIDDIAGLCALYPCDAILVDWKGNGYIPKALIFGRSECFEGRLMAGRGLYEARQVNQVKCE